MPLSEHIYFVAIAFKMTEQVEQQICIQFCIKLEQSSVEPIPMIQKATAMATVDWQLHHDNVRTHDHNLHRVFGETSNHPGDSASLYSPDLAPVDFWLFPKLKSPLKGKRFQTYKIQENRWGS